MAGLDASQLNALRSYYAVQGKNIMTRVMEETFLSKGISVIDFKDQYEHQTGDSTEVVQSYQDELTYKGSVSLSPRVQRHEPWKGDIKFNPRSHNAKAYESWAAQPGNNPYDLPYYGFIVQQLMKQVVEDIALSVLWKGINMGPIAGYANPSTDIANGFLELLYQDIITGKVIPYITGPLSNSNAVEVLEDFVKGNLDTDAKRARKHYLHCSLDIVDMYQKNYRSAYGTYIHANEFGHMRISGTNVDLVPHSGLVGSQRLIMSEQMNMYIGQDGAMSFIVENRARTTYFLLDGKFSVQYALPAEVYCNAQL